MSRIECFKAYDIRGKVPADLNEDLAYNIGRAFKTLLKCRKVVVGYDVRQSSEKIVAALSNGLNDSGVDVINIGLCGTEMIYFGTTFLEADGGIMVTASHNPPEYNGMKFVKAKSVPMGYESGLMEIEKIILEDRFDPLASEKGKVTSKDITRDFIANLDRFYDNTKVDELTVVVNGGNGCVGPILDRLELLLPVKMVKLNNNPDGTFPNGVPNPMLEEQRQVVTDAILENNAHLGVAWDGDYDRCFFYDEKGNFIEGYYIVGLLTKSLLKDKEGEKIIHDPRLVWNTIDIAKTVGAEPVVSQSGHAYIKQKMREVNAIYGGEMSAHHYFRDNAYSDSGIIPFLLVMQLMSEEKKKMSELVGEMIENYPCSGEINSTIDNPKKKLEELEEKYSDGKIDKLDGISVEYDNWRFNVRESNTEPILRLNVESRGDIDLMKKKTDELLKFIRNE